MALDVANALKIAWLRAKDLGAGGSSIASWIDQATGTAQPSAGTAPTVAAASTPGGGKSARFTAGRIDLGLRGVRWTASSYQTDFEPFRAEGNDATTAWAATGAVGWLAFRLEAAVVATSYVLQGRAGASSQWPRNWTFEGSNDGVSWTVLDTRTGADSGLGSLQTFTFSNSTAYSRYRLNVTTTAGGVATAGTLAVGSTAPALARELWMVLKSDAVTPNGSFGSFGASTADYYTYSDGLIYTGALSNARWQFTPTVAVTGWRLLRITHDGTSARAYLDNALQSTTTVGTQFNATGTLGTVGFVGNIAEAMLFDRGLTASEAADLITYFNTEHGLTVPGGTFSPSSLTGNVLWLNAKDLAGSTASTWTCRTTGAPYVAQGAALDVVSVLPGTKAVRNGSGMYAGGGTHGPWNNTDIAKVTSSSTFNTSTQYLPGNVAGNPAGGQWATSGAGAQWWKVQLNTAKVVTGYTLTGVNNNGRNPKNWTFEGSNDDSSWTVLDTQTNQSATAITNTAYAFTNTTAYTYYRLNFTANNGGDIYFMTRIDLTGANLNWTQPAEAEIWAVVKTNQIPGSQQGHWYNMVSGGSGNQYLWSDGGIYDAFGAGRVDNWGAGANLYGFRVYRATISATEYKRYLDGVQQTSSGGQTRSFTRLPVFGGWPGDVAEIVLRNRIANSTESADLLAYFRTEHNLSTIFAQVETVYAETLASTDPLAQVESAYAEVLDSAVPSAVLEMLYAEVLASTGLPWLVESKVANDSGAPTLNTTPTPDDVAVLAWSAVNLGPAVSSVSGLGGTWAQVGRFTSGATGSFHDKNIEYWICYNPSVAGPVTVTATAHGNQSLYLIRGCAVGTTVADGVGTSTTGNKPGPVMNAHSGHFVLSHSVFTDVGGITFPGTLTPPGWTNYANIGLTGGWGQCYHVYRSPFETADTAHQVVPAQSAASEPDLVAQIVVAALPATAAQVEAVYAEGLVTGSPPARVEASYAEALLVAPSAARAEAVYAEALVRLVTGSNIFDRSGTERTAYLLTGSGLVQYTFATKH